MGVGLMNNMAFEIPIFFIMLSWYWIILIIGLISGSMSLIIFSSVVFLLRIAHSLTMRFMAEGKILPVDFLMGLFFDIFGSYYLCYGFTKPSISWRGITYKVRAGGFIEGINKEQEEKV